MRSPLKSYEHPLCSYDDFNIPTRSHTCNYTCHNSSDFTCKILLGLDYYIYLSEQHDLFQALQWRHNERDGVSNHQPNQCLLNRLFGRRSKKTSESASLAFVWGIDRGPVNSPHKWPVTRKMFPFDDVIMEFAYASINALWNEFRKQADYPWSDGAEIASVNQVHNPMVTGGYLKKINICHVTRERNKICYDMWTFIHFRQTHLNAISC